MNRDLDAEIVEKIFNWREIRVSEDINGENGCKILFYPDKEDTQEYYSLLPNVGKIHRSFFAPQYSGDLGLSIELAKHVKLPMTCIADLPDDPEILAKQCLDYWQLMKDRQNKIQNNLLEIDKLKTEFINKFPNLESLIAEWEDSGFDFDLDIQDDIEGYEAELKAYQEKVLSIFPFQEIDSMFSEWVERQKEAVKP